MKLSKASSVALVNLQTRTNKLIPGMLAILITALIWRGVILASNSVSFHSDEAIVGLMARHINQGQPIPTFYYGQAYMGSLDPLLVSLMFRITGESVFSIRLVQMLLYVGTVATTIILAWTLSSDRRVAFAAGLLIAFPPIVLVLYTTISLGGYGETLLFGNLILILGYRLHTRRGLGWLNWLALGAITGLGWWTNSLIVAFALPVGLILLVDLRESLRVAGPRMIGYLVGAFSAFVLFSAPWWLYNLSHQWESIRFLSSGFQAGGPVSTGDKLAGLLLIGVPALFGLRYPWMPTIWVTPILAVTVTVLYLVILISTALRAISQVGAARYLWVVIVTFGLIFVMSGFGVDATGRYLLPFVVPLLILIALQVARRWGWMILAVLIGVNVTAAITAMRAIPPGLTPQFDPITDFPNDSDQAVISFLIAHGGTRGYATYWVAYRLAFLSGEAVTLSPGLPYKITLTASGPDRYPVYTALAAATDRPVLVTANHPTLDDRIRQQLGSLGVVSWKVEQIGPYTIFYDLSQRVTPADLGFGP